MKKFYLILFFINFKSVCLDVDNIQIKLSVPSSKLKQLVHQKQFSINELQYIINDNFDTWIQQSGQIGITCQAVTPLGKHIGTFENPSYTGKNIPGGQSKTCNLWLLPKPKDENRQNPNLPPATELPPLSDVHPKYYAI